MLLKSDLVWTQNQGSIGRSQRLRYFRRVGGLVAAGQVIRYEFVSDAKQRVEGDIVVPFLRRPQG